MSTSVSTIGWSGPGLSSPIAFNIQVVGDLIITDANLNNLDQIDVELSWLEDKVNVICIASPFDCTLRFNYDTTPQNFEMIGGGAFYWDITSGIPCPVTGVCANLRIIRSNPSDAEVGDEIVNIRVNKDATPG